jgi:hypothetical protein
VTEVGGWFAGLIHDEAILYIPTQHAEAVLETANKIFSSFKLDTPQGGVRVSAEFNIVNGWNEK